MKIEENIWLVNILQGFHFAQSKHHNLTLSQILSHPVPLLPQ